MGLYVPLGPVYLHKTKSHAVSFFENVLILTPLLHGTASQLSQLHIWLPHDHARNRSVAFGIKLKPWFVTVITLHDEGL